MEPSGESLSFKIEQVTNQEVFKDEVTRFIFKEWCRVNDHIRPVFLSRGGCRNTEELLQDNKNGTKTLYLPEDLHLWEMVGVVQKIDQDTFSKNPEKQNQPTEKLIRLGKTFRNAGIYIAQRLSSIKEGRSIAEQVAGDFYNYGESLVTGKKPETPEKLKKIARKKLTLEETEQVDRFLAGDQLYESRRKRVQEKVDIKPKKRNKIYEKQRQLTLAQFFRVSQKAFEKQRESDTFALQKYFDPKNPRNEEVPVHTSFISKINQSIENKVKTPKNELTNSVFRRGINLLQEHMPFDKLPQDIKNTFLHWQSQETSLREALQIDKLKDELESVRQSGNLENIAKKEIEITDKIQSVVSNFNYKSQNNNPSEMILTQEINCLGASMLGGSLMHEVGISCLACSIPHHSLLLLVTSDNRVYWRDMLFPQGNNAFTDEQIKKTSHIDNLKISDLVRFSKDPKPEGITLSIEKQYYHRKFPFVELERGQFISVFSLEDGLKTDLQGNLSVALFNSGFKDEAVNLISEALKSNPKNEWLYQTYSILLSLNHDPDQAINALKQAAKINPENSLNYIEIGRLYKKQYAYISATTYYQKGIEVDSSISSYHKELGDLYQEQKKYPEAAQSYQKAANLDPTPSSYADLAYALKSNGEYEAALEAFKKWFENLKDISKDESFIKISQDWMDLNDFVKNQKNNVS